MASSKKDRTKAALVKRLSEVRIVEIACKSIGISRATYYRWLKGGANFMYDCEDAIKQGTAVIYDLAESQIVTKIRSGDFKASTYFLEKHQPEYTPKPHNLAPPYQRNLNKEFFSDDPPDEKEINLLIHALEEMKEVRYLLIILTLREQSPKTSQKLLNYWRYQNDNQNH